MRKLLDHLAKTLFRIRVISERTEDIEGSLRCLLPIILKDRLVAEKGSSYPAVHGFQVYSQREEDGILEYIFNKIGYTNKFFVEFGAGEGIENNSMYLLLKKWSGLWIEGYSKHYDDLRRNFAKQIGDGVLKIINQYVTIDNIQELFRSAAVPAEPDFLSIDIDGNDYWIWKAITDYRPRVICAEYNAGFGPSAAWTIPYDPNFRWDSTRNQGVSLKALELLGTEKGYRLIACNLSGTNAFFVRSDQLVEEFGTNYTSEYHYQPARYHLTFGQGHPTSTAEIAGFNALDDELRRFGQL